MLSVKANTSGKHREAPRPVGRIRKGVLRRKRRVRVEGGWWGYMGWVLRQVTQQKNSKYFFYALHQVRTTMLWLTFSKLKYLNSKCFYVTIPPAPQINHCTMKSFDWGRGFIVGFFFDLLYSKLMISTFLFLVINLSVCKWTLAGQMWHVGDGK